MANYILRKFDDQIWRAFRSRVITEGKTVRWVLTELIKQYTRQGLDTGTTRPAVGRAETDRLKAIRDAQERLQAMIQRTPHPTDPD